MNAARDIISYAEQHDIQLLTKNGLLLLDAPEGVLTDDFLASAKQHKFEIMVALPPPERWTPELAVKGNVWCQDCQHFNGVNCTHTDNPFHTVAKQPLVPRKCQWYEMKLNPD